MYIKRIIFLMHLVNDIKSILLAIPLLGIIILIIRW